jgi:hypothetical protein
MYGTTNIKRKLMSLVEQRLGDVIKQYVTAVGPTVTAIRVVAPFSKSNSLALSIPIIFLNYN